MKTQSPTRLFSSLTDWERSLYSVLFSLTGVCLVPELGSGWVVIVGVQRIRARPQLKGKHTGQLGMAETPFPTRVGGLTLDLRVLIPCVSFLPRLSHQGVFEIGGAEGAKREQGHRVCFAKGLQFSLQAWAPAPCREGTFNLLAPRQEVWGCLISCIRMRGFLGVCEGIEVSRGLRWAPPCTPIALCGSLLLLDLKPTSSRPSWISLLRFGFWKSRRCLDLV